MRGEFLPSSMIGSYQPKHHCRSIRLPGYDYSRAAAYFVTTVSYQRHCLFGEINGGKMHLNEFGKIVAETWQWLTTQYPYTRIGAWCVMPNHFHGILVIVNDDARRGGSRPAPTGNAPSTDAPMGNVHSTNTPTGNAQIIDTYTGPIPTEIIKIQPLGQLIGAFKTGSAKRINLLRDTPGTPVWQRDYYEHIVRDENEWKRIHAYIEANPSKWENDDENR